VQPSPYIGRGRGTGGRARAHIGPAAAASLCPAPVRHCATLRPRNLVPKPARPAPASAVITSALARQHYGLTDTLPQSRFCRLRERPAVTRLPPVPPSSPAAPRSHDVRAHILTDSRVPIEVTVRARPSLHELYVGCVTVHAYRCRCMLPRELSNTHRHQIARASNYQ
jgi:hypothetical protein